MCRPEATHAFSAASTNPRRPQPPKPRAWLRHTPYLNGRGRLKSILPSFRRPLCLIRRAEPDVGCVAPRRRRGLCRAANLRLPRKSQTACVAAPHTLPKRQRPSEKHTAKFQTASLPYPACRTRRRVCRPEATTRSLPCSESSSSPQIPNRVRGCATHPTQRQRPSESAASAQPKTLFRRPLCRIGCFKQACQTMGKAV